MVSDKDLENIGALVHAKNMGNGADPATREGIKKSLSVFDRVAKTNTTKNMVIERIQHSAPNQLHENVSYNNNISESYAPQPMQHSYSGVQNRFDVFPTMTSNGKTRYAVVNMSTQQKVAENLHIQESANAMVKLLNRGHSFYSPEIKNILEYEQKYLKHYNDALNFKRQFTSGAKNQIVETRFEEAKRNAVMVKEQLVSYAKKL